MDQNKYAELTLEELLAEEKKFKKKELFTALLIGIMVGPMIYGVAKGGFGFVYVILPLFLIYAVYKKSIKDKEAFSQIRAEIDNKSMAEKGEE